MYAVCTWTWYVSCMDIFYSQWTSEPNNDILIWYLFFFKKSLFWIVINFRRKMLFPWVPNYSPRYSCWGNWVQNYLVGTFCIFGPQIFLHVRWSAGRVTLVRGLCIVVVVQFVRYWDGYLSLRQLTRSLLMTSFRHIMALIFFQ